MASFFRKATQPAIGDLTPALPNAHEWEDSVVTIHLSLVSKKMPSSSRWKSTQRLKSADAEAGSTTHSHGNVDVFDEHGSSIHR